MSLINDVSILKLKFVFNLRPHFVSHLRGYERRLYVVNHVDLIDCEEHSSFQSGNQHESIGT